MLDGIGQEIQAGDLLIWSSPYARDADKSIYKVKYCTPKKVACQYVESLDTLATRKAISYPLPEHCLIVTEQLILAQHYRKEGV